ncbi:MobF family relaxase [Caulobacter sp. ErkDOM-E]|uniref:MobF family relaxase n=1 Tax=Caulobacter sp. ErkDOM-E TaxID=3402778 RepID=UPI003AF6C438
MVASISGLSNSAQAASYYEADDYYSEGGLAPSAWRGEAADALGLSGDVDRDQFKALLDGFLPTGDVLGTVRNGEREHRPGWDLTFSAPKSLSVMALVAGDTRLIKAHDEAAATALAYVERYGAATRIREGGRLEHVPTGNLVAATFRHETSRAQDPQLHTHSVILNATQDAKGTWRSMEGRTFFQLQKAAGEIYRQELAQAAHRLGYTIEAGKESAFEIGGVPDAVLKAFSERAAQIEAHLAERGKTRETASPAEKQMATLDTRQAKEAADRGELVATWRATADATGFDRHNRLAMVAAAEAKNQDARRDLELRGEAEAVAYGAIRFAAEKLGERQAVFSAAELEKEAGRRGIGRAGQAEMLRAIDRAVETGELSPRVHRDRRGIEGVGFTTAGNIAAETRLLQAEYRGRGQEVPLASPIGAARLVAEAALRAEDRGHVWTQDQRAATQSLLTSRSQVVAVQGYAGTAKTTTVLATFAKAAREAGLTIRALAPSASAARTLGDALSLEGQTLARHLKTQEAKADPVSAKREIWLVDEASLVSARDMARLLESAEFAGARTVLVGDLKQLGSVGAGAAFAQLQGAGMETARLTEIVRQTNTLTRQAVEATLEGQVRRAFEALDAGGGRVIEAGTPEARRALIAADYAALNAEARGRTIVIDPSREGRDALTVEIRAQLVERGVLSERSVTARGLVAKDLTRAEARQADSYAPGDVVIFNKRLDAEGVARGDAFTVAAVDERSGTVGLINNHDRKLDWAPAQWGQAEAFTTTTRELRVGDRIEFTRNDHAGGRANGTQAEVTRLSDDGRSVEIRDGRGRVEALSLDCVRDQHIRHAYVQTAYAAQGRTADRVMVHAESGRANLIDQASIYVAISRARSEATVYTDDREKLTRGVQERMGEASMAFGRAGIQPQHAAGPHLGGIAD